MRCLLRGLLWGAVALAGFAAGGASTDVTRFVNEFIGMGGHGHTHPGATVPFGMVALGPDTFNDTWDANVAFGRLTIGRSLPSCPTTTPGPSVRIRSASSCLAVESRWIPLSSRAPGAVI
jgi:hypothetical protein